jgi:hypothetical protein
VSVLSFAIPAAIAFLGLCRLQREHAQTLALAATAVLWVTVVALVIAWS